MTAPVFLVDPARLAGGDVVVVDGAEGRHAAAVRRMRVGEPLILADGVGRLAECVVAGVSRDRVECAVLSRRQVPRAQPRLVVVQALAKGQRAELAVEGLTEVGVDVIVPWAAARCVVHWPPERAANGVARWRSTSREAAKQARRAWLPEVADLTSTEDAERVLRGAALGVVLHESAARSLAEVDVPAVGDVVLVVGPEGGLTEGELDGFAASGAAAYRLGPTVLRTSTAGVVGAAVLLARTPRWAPHTGP